MSDRQGQRNALHAIAALAALMGALSGGIYIPFELQHWIQTPSIINASILALNTVIVGYLARALWNRRAHTPEP